MRPPSTPLGPAVKSFPSAPTASGSPSSVLAAAPAPPPPPADLRLPLEAQRPPIQSTSLRSPPNASHALSQQSTQSLRSRSQQTGSGQLLVHASSSISPGSVLHRSSTQKTQHAVKKTGGTTLRTSDFNSEALSESELVQRKYAQSTVIKDGILDKWTNYLGAWRARYFIVEPGILKYANGPGQPVKETYPLMQCSTRFCPTDAMRLEVEHPHGVLYLRMRSIEEKKLWIDALLKAKNAFQFQNQGGPCRAALLPNSTNSRDDGAHKGQSLQTTDTGPPPRGSCRENELKDHPFTPPEPEGYKPTDSERCPTASLLDHFASCRSCLQSANADIRQTQAALLRVAGNVKDPPFRQDVKNLSLRLVETLDHLQLILQRYITASRVLVLEEQRQRRMLERSFHSLVRRNYRMSRRFNKLQKVIVGALGPRAFEAAGSEFDKPRLQQSVSENSSSGSQKKHLRSVSLDDTEEITDQAPQSINHIKNGAQSTLPILDEKCLRVILGLIAGRAGGGVRAVDNQEYSSEDEFDSDFASNDDDEASSELDGEPELPEEAEDEFFDVEEPAYETPQESTRGSERGESTYISPKPAQGVAFASPVSANCITRRTCLPKPRTEFKITLWSMLKDCIGKDLSRISMPVYFNEPTSFLQRLAEDFQYVDLLKMAAKQSDSLERLLWVTVFSISPYAGTVGRTYKPFNPLLGETFELSHRGFRFLAEQVGHHPPVTAYHADADEFDAWGHLVVKTRFTGKSVEVSVPGPANIVLHCNRAVKEGGGAVALVGESSEKYVDEVSADSAQSHERYTFQRSKAIVNNVIFGKLNVEMFGPVVITNHDTGDCAFVEYLRQGWWNRELHVVRGVLFDAEGIPRYRVGGWWSRELWVEELQFEEGEDLQLAKITPARSVTSTISPAERGGQLGGQTPFSSNVVFQSRNPMDINVNWELLTSQTGSRRVIWRSNPLPAQASLFYEFSQMAMELNELSPDYDPKFGSPMPPTDSRFRMDQKYLEEGRVEEANAEKCRLEENQRIRSRARVGGEESYVPRWFVKREDGITGHPVWVSSKEYWSAKLSNDFKRSMRIFD